MSELNLNQVLEWVWRIEFYVEMVELSRGSI